MHIRPPLHTAPQRNTMLASLLCVAVAACSAEPASSSSALVADAGGAGADGLAADGDADAIAANDTTSDTAPPDAGPQQPEIVWAPCTGTYQGVTAECATLILPLDWSNPDTEGLPINVARIKAKKPRRGALWLLQGGPGGDGSGLAPIAAEFAKKVPDLDLYLPDHRGTGLSARLGCETQEAATSIGGAAIVSFEWQGCLKTAVELWGDNLAHFTPSNAARDLHAWIDATRQEGDKVFIYGVSYGTYWAHRYLQIFPKEPDGVVLDSVCPPGVCVGDQYDVVFNQVGKAYLDLCGQDELCASKLGKTPWKLLGDLYSKLEDKKHCPNFTQKVAPLQLRSLFAVLLRQVQMRAVIPALIYRLDRCSPADEIVLSKIINLMQYLGGGLMPNPGVDGLPKFATAKTFSELLNAHILMSEMWSVPAPSYAKVQADFLATYIAPGATQNTLLLFDKWPTFKRDEYANTFAATDVPVLLLNGTLDPQTPDFYAKAMFDGLKAPNKRLVLMPGAAHGTVNQAPMFTGGMCGMELSGQFFSDPTKAVDTACVGLLVPVAFTLPSYIVQQFLGITDLFENDGKTDSLTAPHAPWPDAPWSPTPGLPRWQ